MHRMIAYFDLMPNLEEFVTTEQRLAPELLLAGHLIQMSSIGALFKKSDFKEFIVRICLRYGLFTPQETYFNNDFLLSAEFKETGETIFFEPKNIARYIGLIAIEGRLNTVTRDVFLESLVKGQRSAIWMEVFSAFKIHRWEDRKDSENKVVISIRENTPEISDEHISNAEAFADFITRELDEDIFKSFYKKNRPIIKVLERMEWEIGSIKFDIRSIKKDFLESFITAFRGEGFFDEEVIFTYDEEEYAMEFALMKLAWVVASGYTEYEYYMGSPVNLHVDPRVDFDHDDYEGLMHDDFGGINILQTYIDYGLESVVIYLQNIAPLLEQDNNDE